MKKSEKYFEVQPFVHLHDEGFGQKKRTLLAGKCQKEIS